MQSIVAKNETADTWLAVYTCQLVVLRPLNSLTYHILSSYFSKHSENENRKATETLKHWSQSTVQLRTKHLQQLVLFKVLNSGMLPDLGQPTHIVIPTFSFPKLFNKRWSRLLEILNTQAKQANTEILSAKPQHLLHQSVPLTQTYHTNIMF